MATRPLISYDDITLPYEQPEVPQPSRPSPSYHSHPPAKKRRRNNNNQKGKHPGGPGQAGTFKTASFSQDSRYNASGSNSESMYGQEAAELYAGEAEEGEYPEAEEEESRELTHEEIWDDSALVNAWEAAAEEYELYHAGKDWKKEPVKKSPLWYNIPLDPSAKKADMSSSKAPTTAPVSAPTAAADEDAHADSQPLNFDTFVPTHDPSLPTPPPLTSSYVPDTPAGPMISQDEAFSRALSAMYWGGYWTAMYHAQRHLGKSRNHSAAVDNADELEEEEIEEMEVEELEGDAQMPGFVSTER